jgi:Endonuclease/Exonuclease/phosphatase family.
MNNIDKIEISNVDVWKNNEHHKIYCCYNPPTNVPNLSPIQIQTKTVIIGDFNAHSPTWGYNDLNGPGKEIEDFINTNNVELIFKKTDPPTFIYHSGSCSNPDLLLVSSDIADQTHRQVLEDPGSGHRAIMATITKQK